MKPIRIFVSSPGDVAEERQLALRVITRLKAEWAGQAELEPIYWEHEPLLATATFQDQIPRPSETDIVVCILWSRLGTRLPSQYRRPDGSTYASGTEFEFEDAVEGRRAHGAPDLLVYRKNVEAMVVLKDESALMERLRQKQNLDAFAKRWFHDEAEGTLIAAFHGFARSSDFEELLEIHLRKLLAVKIPAGARAAARPVSWTAGSPFRGLEPFDHEHAAVFFGRTRAVAEVLETLRRQAAAGRAFALVTGTSGSGKSSLVRAGVVPLLMQPGVIEGVGLWRRAAVRPSEERDPFGALAAALTAPGALPELTAGGTSSGELATLLADAPAAVPALIKSALALAAAEFARAGGLVATPEARLVLVVDQLEELFTVERITAEVRKKLAATLSALVQSGRVWALATLRADFFPRLTEVPELSALKGAGQYDVLPPTPGEISQMIRQPAQAAGLWFEEHPDTGARLDDDLRDAASRDPGALPLLEFALEELWQRRSPDGILTLASYRELGGLEGALARKAEETYTALAPGERAAFAPVMRMLVAQAFGTEAVFTRRRAPRSALAQVPGGAALADAFTAARLLVADRGADGAPELAVAHEALFRHWPRLAELLAAERATLRARAFLAGSAARWEQSGRASDELLAGARAVAEASDLLEHHAGELTRAEAEYAQASVAAASAAARARLRLLQVLAMTFLVLAVGALAAARFGFTQAGRAAQAERDARRVVARVDVRTALERIAAGEPALAAAYLARAGRMDPEQDAVGRLLPGLLSDHAWLLPAGPALAHERAASGASVSPDGARVLSVAGPSAYLWERATGRRIAVTPAGGYNLFDARFAPDGKRFVTLTANVAALYDGLTAAPLARLPHPSFPCVASFSADGGRLLTVDLNGEGMLWDSVRGTKLTTFAGAPGLSLGALSPDGTRVALGPSERPVTVYDAATGRAVGPPLGKRGAHVAAFSPDGQRLAVDVDGELQLFDPAKLELVARTAHGGPVIAALFSADSRRMFTLSLDRRARVFDARTGVPLTPPVTHVALPKLLAIAPSGARFATASEGGVVQVFDGATGRAEAELRLPVDASSVELTPDASSVVVTTKTSGVYAFELRAGVPPGRSVAAGGKVVQLWAEPPRLVRADGTLVALDAGATQATPVVTLPKAVWVAPDGDGRRIAWVDADGRVRLGAADGAAATAAPVAQVARVDRLAVNADATRIAAVAGTLVLVLDAQGKQQHKLSHGHLVREVAYLRDRLVAVDMDGVVTVWDADGKRVGAGAKAPGMTLTARVTRDGSRVARAAMDGVLTVCDLDGRPLCPPFAMGMLTRALAWSADGRWLAAGTNDGRVRVFDANLSPVRETFRHGGIVTAVAFTPAGNALWSAGLDGAVRIWPLVAGEGPTPAWLPDLAELATGLRLGDEALATPLPADRSAVMAGLRERVAGSPEGYLRDLARALLR